MASPASKDTELIRSPAVSTSVPTPVVTPRWFVPALLVLAVIATTLARWSTLQLPLERDEGAYATMASLWLDGALPYRDAFDHKPPLVYVLYMPPLLAGGDPTIAIRAWAALLFLLQLPLVYGLGRTLWNPLAAALATLIYAIIGSAFRLQGVVFNTEQALMLPALTALSLLVRAIADPRLRWRVGYGVCLGLVALIKPTIVPFLLALPFIASRSPLEVLRDMSAAVAGMVLPWVPVVVVWGSLGAWSDLVNALVTYNRLYAAESLRTWQVGAVVDVVAPLGASLVVAVGGVALAGWRTTRARQRSALVGWTLAGLAAAVLSLRGYIHYYYPALSGLALLAAPTIARLLERRDGKPLWNRLAAALLVAVLLVPFGRDMLVVARLNPTAQAARLYGEDGTRLFAAAPAVGRYVRSVTAPDQPIFVWASEPEIYLFADRRPASRLIYSYPLYLVPATNAALAAELREHPPGAVVLYRGLRPALLIALAEQHGLRMVEQIGGYDIWAIPPP